MKKKKHAPNILKYENFGYSLKKKYKEIIKYKTK